MSCTVSVVVVVDFSSPTQHALPSFTTLACASSVMPHSVPFGVIAESGLSQGEPTLTVIVAPMPSQVADEVHVGEFCTDVIRGIAVDVTMADAGGGGARAQMDLEDRPVGLLTPHSLRRAHVSRGDSRVAVLTVLPARVAGLGDQVHLGVGQGRHLRVAGEEEVARAHRFSQAV